MCDRKSGFNLASELNKRACSAVMLATFCIGITAYAGTIQQNSKYRLLRMLRCRMLVDRVSSAPDKSPKRLSAEPNNGWGLSSYVYCTFVVTIL